MSKSNDVLDIVFKITDGLEYEVAENSVVTILEKQDHKIQKFFRKLKARIPRYKKIELDEYSSFVFLQIDGQRTVREIGKNLEAKYGEESHPLYERLLVFLNHIEVNCHYIERLDI